MKLARFTESASTNSEATLRFPPFHAESSASTGSLGYPFLESFTVTVFPFSLTLSPAALAYSFLNVSTGFIRAARPAGRNLETMPVTSTTVSASLDHLWEEPDLREINLRDLNERHKRAEKADPGRLP